MAEDDATLAEALEAIASLGAAERLQALSELGFERAGVTTPGLERFLSDENAAVRIAAAQAVLHTDAGASHAFQILIDALTGADEDLALAAGTAIVECEQNLTRNLAESLERLNHPLIARVVGEIGGDAARAVLQHAAENSRHAAVREEAREALEELEKED